MARDIAGIAGCENVVAKLGGLAMPDNGFGWHSPGGPPDVGRVRRGAAALVPPHPSSASVPTAACSSRTSPSTGTRDYVVLWNAFKRIAADYTPEEKR